MTFYRQIKNHIVFLLRSKGLTLPSKGLTLPSKGLTR